MSPKSIFVTGANRGIGLELVRQYAARSPAPTHLFAGYRTMSEELKLLAEANANITTVKMDVTQYETFPDIAKQVRKYNSV